MQYTTISGGICAPQGFAAAGVKAGIKSLKKEDVAIVYSEKLAAAAGVYTLNKMCAAPVIVTKEHLAGGYCQAIVINSGCANACTGERGLQDAYTMTAATGKALGIKPADVAVASTGVIGTFLPMDKVTSAIHAAASALSPTGHEAAARAIMTTDTFSKQIAVELTLGGTTVKIGAMAKGSGMIEPNMATMLGFISTDAAIAPQLLTKALKTAVERSFNAITVDGDTSTNDMVVILANGLANNPVITAEDDDFAAFYDALEYVCIHLAQLIVRDGEGATKFIEIKVTGANDCAEAKQAAKAIAKSPLVKTAFFGQDPNWGRIVAAAGYSGAQLDAAKVALWIGGQQIVAAGQGTAASSAALKQIMAEKDIAVVLDLGVGTGEATVWTCDFSYEYVRINGEYTT